MKALIIKNISHEGPGIIQDILDIQNIKYDIIDLSHEVLLPNIDQFNLIIIMGGPDSANDKSEKILKELDYIKISLDKRIPIFGICLGLQLIVKVLGGNVLKNFVKEIGFKMNEKWNTICITPNGFKDPIFNGIKKEFKAFHLHGETISLVEKMKLLATGEYCENQVIKWDNNTYGFQFHLEMTDTMFHKWLKKAPELRKSDFNQLTKDWNDIKEEYT